jgi:threonyl-tRNA synthetase
MPTITLPDGAQRRFDQPVSARAVAEAISPGLAKKAIAAVIDGQVRDLATVMDADAQLKLLTADDNDAQALEVLRHSCAHVLAEAVCSLLPGTRLAYGPAVEDGFFYDMATPRPVTTEDFAAIETKMAEIIAADRPFVRCDYAPAEGLARTAGDKYKTDNAERALAKGAASLSFYTTGTPGQHFEDLCAGPHVPSTRFLKAHKVMAVAGAYWHGDQSSDQLTRLYGTCFASDKALKAHLQRLEEAKARDHRKLGRELDLFHLDDENPGQIYWHHKGWTIYRTIEQYVRDRQLANGYIEVKTPSIQPQGLWERSGHWAKYRDNMFLTAEKDRSDKDAASAAAPAPVLPQGEGVRLYALKPMNCPGHITIFQQGLKSYRDLPIRMSEFGSCMRFEPSGALHGIMRVRGFVQDDAHIFCTEEQIGAEVAAFCDLLKSTYADFGFNPDTVLVRFSTRPPLRVGSDADWDRAEAALAAACTQARLKTELNPGEGAFYGPKLEFVLTDCLGRSWQCGTIQVDYMLAGPERLNATYIAADGTKKHPVILHRAVLGSLERFIGILIEEYAGKFPLWLAPEQIRILPITDAHLPYARRIADALRAAGLRATVDENPDKLGAKIRNARNDRVNYHAVVGDAEADAGTAALSKQDGSKIGTLRIEEICAWMQSEIHGKSRRSNGA